jgi:hypothetical protein
MRILSLQPEPLLEIPFLNAGRKPMAFYEDRLPVLAGFVEGLPDGVAAIVATSDLQGRECFAGKRPIRLLGEVLPALLDEEVLPKFGLPPCGEMGVLLAGDFYTVPALDRRGGTGDVTEVWQAFGDRFAWVAGVAGNHDTFGDQPDGRLRLSWQNVHYLDGDRVRVGGLALAGIGGIIGDPARPRRRSDEDYAALVALLLEQPTDLLMLHDGPDAPEWRCRGSPRVREAIERQRPGLVIRGHRHWDVPLVELSSGVQVLNVHERVVVLRQAPDATRETGGSERSNR